MSKKILSLTDELRLVYQDIINGYSISDDGQIFFKHFSELENITLLRKRFEFYTQYIKEGLPTEAERLEELINQGEWSAQKEDDILSLKLTISDNEAHFMRVIKQQQGTIRAVIERSKKELGDIFNERHQLLGTTAEEISGIDITNYSLFLSCFTDSSFTIPFFKSWSEFEKIESEQLDDTHNLFDKSNSRFNEKAIRQVSVMPFFLNLFSYSKENLYTFLGKPMIYLTNYQTFLFSLGQRNLNVLSQCNGSPPEIMQGEATAEDVLNWYDGQYSILLGKRNAAN